MGFPRRTLARPPIRRILIGVIAGGLALPATTLSTTVAAASSGAITLPATVSPGTAAPAIGLLSSSSWTEPFPGGAAAVHIVGQVQNNTVPPVDVSWVRINIDLADATPNDASYTYATVNILGPGEVSPFQLDLVPVPAGYTGYTIGAITYIPAVAQPYHSQLAANLTGCPAGSSSDQVCGTVKNNGPNTVENVQAILTYRDSSTRTVAQEHPLVQNAGGGATLIHNEIGSFEVFLAADEPVGTNIPLILAEPNYSLDINPDAVDFGGVNVGKTGQLDVTLMNTGTVTVTFSAPQPSPNPPFTASSDCKTAGLSGGDSCHVTVKFMPTAAGNQSGTLTLTDTAAGSQQVIPVEGKGTAPAVAFDRSVLDFGSTVRAAKSGSKTASLVNVGDGPLTITAFSTDDPTDFSVDGAGCLAAPFTLPPGGLCPIVVTFHPGIGGPYGNLANSNQPDVNLVVTDDAGTGTQKLPLQGIALGPGALLTANSQPVRGIVYGDELLAFTSSPAAVTLMNNGTEPLSIASIAASGDYSEADNCRFFLTLAAGASCTISITFTPSQLGDRSGTLTITDNAGSGQQSITLTGTGVSGVGSGRRADSGVDRERMPPATIVIRRR